MQEGKQVLDSWVRYEGQVKQRQQRELAENVIAKIMKELENPKTMQQILQQSVADVESRFPNLSPIQMFLAGTLIIRYRDHWVKGPVGLRGCTTIVDYLFSDKTCNMADSPLSII